MSDEIHAGIVGGLLGAAAVLIGVIGTEWAIRMRDRRASVVEASVEVAVLLPAVMVPISRMSTDRPDTNFDSVWSSRRDQVVRLLLRIERDARWPMRNAAKIRESARDTLARFGALSNLWVETDIAVTPDQYSDLFAGQPSHVTMVRDRDEFFARIDAYQARFGEEQRAAAPDDGSGAGGGV